MNNDFNEPKRITDKELKEMVTPENFEKINKNLDSDNVIEVEVPDKNGKTLVVRKVMVTYFSDDLPCDWKFIIYEKQQNKGDK